MSCRWMANRMQMVYGNVHFKFIISLRNPWGFPFKSNFLVTDKLDVLASCPFDLPNPQSPEDLCNRCMGHPKKALKNQLDMNVEYKHHSFKVLNSKES